MWAAGNLPTRLLSASLGSWHSTHCAHFMDFTALCLAGKTAVLPWQAAQSAAAAVGSRKGGVAAAADPTPSVPSANPRANDSAASLEPSR